MVISVLEHGLGNQLFQYAAGRAVAERLGATQFLDKVRFSYNASRALGITQFRIRARLLPDRVASLLDISADARGVKSWVREFMQRQITTLKDAQKGYDEGIASVKGACRLDGYWQSERYFRQIRPQLLEELQPHESLTGALADFVGRAANEESVAVHIRRGDVTIKSLYATTAGALAVEYYAEALKRFASRIPSAKFYVFSDDPAWCEKHLPRIAPMEIVSGKLTTSAVQDLTVMKHCRHFVTGNSTFSWWAAWLGNHPDKLVLAPARFFRVPVAWEKDLRPPEWETMEPIFEEI